MIPPVFLLNQASEVSALGVAKRGRAGWTDGELVGPTTWRFLHRPGKDGAATRVDAICMHRPDPKGPGLDREQLYLAQTPQIFDFNLYHAAAYYALENKFSATDDNSLIEFINPPVRLVDRGRENIKITTPVDLIFAEAIP